ncbi:hypothetical protein [[Mycobacterium] crassicus]|uniref:RecT-like ssDNA binding protein n=1 Tax=[Mycobacterium] crassicus TaxID=2872309 RepID=A0ABU5XG68_9MYCO|nr:hypothetical protein [Mycolicibacter sp. MYC098]MEB3021278.1 hypothetical protein [Mycolicibacter sp. MYC098]
MTPTEIATASDSSLSILPPAQAPSVAARQMLLAHAEMMQTAHQLAVGMVRTEMVPKRFQGSDKAHDATAAILYGAELGLNPIQSLQRIIPIHGMPSLESRTMVALLKSRGYKIKTIEQSAEAVTVQGIDLDGEVYESTWTIERARVAGYVPEPAGPESLKRPNVKTDWAGETKSGRNGSYHVVTGNMKYITDPQAMLKAKAQSEICREMAPDVLLGISYTSEELQSENWDSDLARQQVRVPSGRGAVVTVDEIMTDVAPPVPDLPDRTAELAAARQRAKAHMEAGTMPDPNEDLDAAEAYAEFYMRPDEALAYLAGGDGVVEPAEDAAQEAAPAPEQVAEPEPAAAEPEPAPAPEPAPEPVKAAKTQTRKALEKRLFKLLSDAEITVENREDRLIVYRFIVGRDTIGSTDDLNDVEVAKVCDVLYEWARAKVLNDKVTEILNSATLAQDDA